MQPDAGVGQRVVAGAGNFRRSVLYQWAGVVIFVLAAVALAVRGDWMWRFDQTLYDTALKLWQRAPSADIVIVGVDEASLARLGGWPFPRSLHAQVVDRLTRAGAKAIGFDVIFAEPSAPAEDARFAAAIAASGRVVLPVHMDGSPGGKAHEIRPVAALAAHARLAHVHIELDADGMARSLYLREGAGKPEFPHLSAALVMAARGDDVSLPGMRRPVGTADPDAWVRDYWLHIPFAGPPGRFATVSYADVLQGRVADAVFRDRIVLVGAVAPGMLDSYPTPVSGGARSMPGVEISANAIDAILIGADIRPVGAQARMGLSLLLLLPLLAGLLWLEPRRAFLLAAGSSALILLLAVFAARYPGVWFAPSVPALAALLAYPFWSWRRLEATQQFLEGEMAAMSGEPGVLDAPAQRGWREISDPIERRIAVVRSASSRLRAARRFIADVVEHQPQATLVADAQGRVVLGNQRAAALCLAAGAGAAGLHGRALDDLLGALHTSQGAPLSGALLAGGVAAEAQSEDGRAWLASAAPLSGEDERALGSIVSLADITELRDAQKKREEYMAFLSHDMRSPQVSIIALLELAKLAPERAPGDLANRIEAHARKTLSLADDFVQLARAEEKDPASFVPLDLATVLREAIDEQSALAGRKFITIETDADLGVHGPQMISGDQQLLVRVISNLLSNAVKYSHGGRAIYCSLVRLEDGGECELRIRDQGFGISAEDLPQLFDRFSRFDAPGASRNAGSGLGLAFVKTVLDKHGAKVDVQSALEVGTTFSLRFSLLAETAAGA